MIQPGTSAPTDVEERNMEQKQKQIAWKAAGNAGHLTGPTARAAAQAYFERYPNSRKCSVFSGWLDGEFFIMRFGKISEGDWPTTYRDVTKKTVNDLPE